MKKLTALIPFALVFTVACGQTDAGITTDVKTKLAADDTVKAYQIDVDTQDHVVTLSGNVETTLAREQALLVARGTTGVRDVVDNLRVADATATTGVDVDESLDRAEINAREAAADTKEAAKDAAEHTKDAAGHTAERVGEAGKDVGHEVGEAGKDVGGAAKDAAKKTGSAAKKGAEAVADGAKKVGSAVKDAVTRDDKDGK